MTIQEELREAKSLLHEACVHLDCRKLMGNTSRELNRYWETQKTADAATRRRISRKIRELTLQTGGV